MGKRQIHVLYTRNDYRLGNLSVVCWPQRRRCWSERKKKGERERNRVSDNYLIYRLYFFFEYNLFYLQKLFINNVPSNGKKIIIFYTKGLMLYYKVYGCNKELMREQPNFLVTLRRSHTVSNKIKKRFCKGEAV